VVPRQHSSVCVQIEPTLDVLHRAGPTGMRALLPWGDAIGLSSLIFDQLSRLGRVIVLVSGQRKKNENRNRPHTQRVGVPADVGPEVARAT